MRSKKVTLAIPHRLWEALEKHAPEVGYANPQQLLIWCAVYSLIVQKPHVITAPMALAPAAAQDEVIEEVVSAYERGETRHGSYFENVIADVVRRFGVELPETVVRSVVSDTVRNRKRPAK